MILTIVSGGGGGGVCFSFFARQGGKISLSCGRSNGCHRFAFILFGSCACACACVRAFVRSCVRAFVRSCVRAFVRSCVVFAHPRSLKIGLSKEPALFSLPSWSSSKTKTASGVPERNDICVSLTSLKSMRAKAPSKSPLSSVIKVDCWTYTFEQSILAVVMCKEGFGTQGDSERQYRTMVCIGVALENRRS